MFLMEAYENSKLEYLKIQRSNIKVELDFCRTFGTQYSHIQTENNLREMKGMLEK